MSGPSQPKEGAPAEPAGTPVEGATRAFKVKFDGWMNELFDPTQFDLEAPAAEAPVTLAEEQPAPPDAKPKTPSGG